MSSVSFLRHAGWFGPEDAQTLNIVGVGATGSHIGLIAAKMGFHNFRVWDADIVEDHNLPNQIYDVEHVGKPKVEAFKSVLQRFNPSINVETHNYFFDSSHKSFLDGPLVLTVDTMSARKEAVSTFKLNWKVNKVFETRLGFDFGELNIVDNMDVLETDAWSECLLDDKDLPEGPCNLRICTTLVSMVASYTVHCICAMLNSKRSDNEWSYSKKTLFNLDPKITTHNLG
jgi:hypothetical protein